MKARIKEVTGNILFELVIVVFGILLALGINGWYQDRQMKQQADKLLLKLDYEMHSNFDSLQKLTAIYDKNITLTNQYLAELKKGKAIDLDYSIELLEVDFAVWRFIQNRQELDQLPVDLLIAISAGYRALERADKVSNEFGLSKVHKLINTLKDNEQQALAELLIEFQEIKFNLGVAEVNLKQSKKMVEQYKAS